MVLVFIMRTLVFQLKPVLKCKPLGSWQEKKEIGKTTGRKISYPRPQIISKNKIKNCYVMTQLEVSSCTKNQDAMNDNLHK